MPTATAKPTWFKMRADNGVGTISIFGDIGGFGITFEDFNRQLEALGNVNEIKLAINSPGGDVFTGFAIYNALQLHPAKKTVTVMGLAASMASIIAMTGDTRIMPTNSMLMIHNPVGAIVGTSDELLAYGEAVGNMRTMMADIYAENSGGKLSQKKAYALMDAQSWITAGRAVELGLATEVGEKVKVEAKFDLSCYANAPKNYLSTKESAMTTKTETEGTEKDTATQVAEAVAAERAKILATQTQVVALCKIAGKPNLAADFNAKGFTVEQAMAELEKAKPEQTQEVSAHARVNTGDEPSALIDTAAIWARYNSQGKKRAA